MGQHLVALIPTTLLVGGCSLIYNPSNISKPPSDANAIDGTMTADARIDAPPLFDANPSMLVLDDVAPNVIYEGQGQGGARPALVVIRGHHIVADGLTVSISPSTGLTLGAPMSSNNGDYIAIPVSVAITGTASGTTALTITVEQTGGPTGGVALTGKLALQHLPEFPAGTNIAASSLAPLYSVVDTNSNITITGDATKEAIIRSVSSIKIGDINVAGASGGSGTFGVGGPGGCPGAVPGSPGGCSQNDGGGGGANGTAGGGGGGFSAPGGGGAGGGVAGVAHGNEQVVNYAGPAGMANQSAGGGGGAAQSLGEAGGGGGGGGTLELAAGGNIAVGAINANGGKGGDANSLLSAGGGGGGGSGGVVVLRTEAGTVMAAGISAAGGNGGAKVGNGGAGGMGGPGRVRVDLPAPGAMLPIAVPAARRGVSFLSTTPVIQTTDNPTLTLAGTKDDVVDAYVIDADDVPHFGEPMNVKLVNEAASMTPTLLPGYNKLCVTLRPGTRGERLADTCIEMAYLP